MRSILSVLKDLVETLGPVGGVVIIIIVSALVTILAHLNWTSA